MVAHAFSSSTRHAYLFQTARTTHPPKERISRTSRGISSVDHKSNAFPEQKNGNCRGQISSYRCEHYLRMIQPSAKGPTPFLPYLLLTSRCDPHTVASP